MKLRKIRRTQDQGEKDDYSAKTGAAIDSVDLDERLLTINIFCPIEGSILLRLKKVLDTLQKFAKQKRKPCELTVNINSVGGELLTGLAMHDLIRACKIPVKTVAVGDVFSVALLIFLAGRKRFVHPNAFLFAHTARQDLGECNKTEIRNILNQLELLEQCSDKIILTNSKLTRKQLERFKEEEKYITAKEAVKYGLAHAIIRGNNNS